MYMPFLALIYKTLGHLSYGLGVFGILASDINFRDQITLGTIILTGVIIIISGIFTIRTKIAAVWRESYEAEKTAKEQAQKELLDEKHSRMLFDKAQQELRHELKTQIGILQANLIVAENKTDLSAATQAIGDLKSSQEDNFGKTQQLLSEIRDGLLKGQVGDI